MGGQTICSRPIKAQVFPPISLSLRHISSHAADDHMGIFAAGKRKGAHGSQTRRDVLRMPRPESDWFIRILIRLRLVLRTPRFILASTIKLFRTSCRQDSRGDTIRQARVPSGRRRMPFSHICQSTGPGGTCQGREWVNNVDLRPSDVLADIRNCNLRSVSWVIPAGQNSDHAGNPDNTGGPAWVAAIVNAIGNNPACPNGEVYWQNTAIFITWDDWGGWYDHEPPTILPRPQGDYQYGFRVPLIVVSAYTPAGYISNFRYDFGSILRFIEHNFGIPEGQLNFADRRAARDLRSFFDLDRAPRPFQGVSAAKDASYFLNDKTVPDGSGR